MTIKFVYGQDYLELIGGVHFDDLALDGATSKKVEYFDEATGYALLFEGHDLKVKHGVIVKGEITGLEYVKDGDAFISVSKAHIDAATLDHDSFATFFTNLDKKLVNADGKIIGWSGQDSIGSGKGDDVIFAKGGDDLIWGGLGNDRMTGGAGFDTFIFKQGDGKDIVTDFDAIGGEGNQDFIAADYDAIQKRGHNGDTIIDLGGGDTLTLLDVRNSDIDETDFVDPPF